MSYVPSDNARSYRDSDGNMMITYTAIPVDIPNVYRTQLIQLGDWCRRSIGKPDYVMAQKELDTYERKLRSEFGKLVTREERFPKEWSSRDD